MMMWTYNFQDMVLKVYQVNTMMSRPFILLSYFKYPYSLPAILDKLPINISTKNFQGIFLRSYMTPRITLSFLLPVRNHQSPPGTTI